MEHVVFFTENSGEPEFRRVGDLEEAVRLVEVLRNERGIADVSVHALTPVPVSFRTYYRVEIGVEAPESVPAAVEPEVAEVIERAGNEHASEAFVVEFDEAPEVPSLEVPSLEVPSLEDEAPAVSALALLPPPVEPSPVFELDEVVAAEESEPVSEAEAVFQADAAFQAEPADDEDQVDEFEALASYEPLVPQVRPEPEPERSLGYFA